MLGGAAAAGAYTMGMVSDALSSVAFTTSAIVVSAAGAVVVGYPVLVSGY
jgi:ABC-type branched-subunit amino acid transport system permease subunit